MVVPIILAAGASRRMGTIKALLDFDGNTCLERVLVACRDGGAAPAIVVLGPEHDAVRSRVPLQGHRVVINPDRERGQTSSLLVGLSVLPADATGFLIFPVDHPLVTASQVRTLLQAFEQRPSGTDIVSYSVAGRRGHPIAVSTRLVPEFVALPADGSARAVINAVPSRVFYIPSDDPGLVSDMDTPDDYKRLLEISRQAESGH